MYKIVASIVIYKPNLDKLQKAISSFLSNDIKQIKLCIIDNSPNMNKDSLRDYLEDSRVEYIFNNKNIGYGAGHNIAIAKYINETKYHLVLNPDIYFDQYLLNNLYSKMEEDENIGLCIPKILFPNSEMQYVNRPIPSAFNIFSRFAYQKLPKIFKRSLENKIHKDELRFIDHSKNFICPAISGCFMFFRATTLKQIGMFDERFFMYFEDIDISRRAMSVGKNMVFSDVVAFHSWERGSHKNTRLLFQHITSAIKYFNKWGWFFDKQRKILNHYLP